MREGLAASIEEAINEFEGVRRVDRTTARSAADAILSSFDVHQKPRERTYSHGGYHRFNILDRVCPER